MITLGPPSAENVLREALACGADSGVLITDPAFAGSDTLATAAALAATLHHLGDFDLILCGRNSVDADTGQVPPQIAQLLALPFATGVKELELADRTLALGLEHDDEWIVAEVPLPALISCAERLCDPCKIKDPEVWATVDDTLITTVTAADLGPGPWGQAGSPTTVGTIRAVDMARDGLRFDPSDIAGVMAALERRGALSEAPIDEQTDTPVREAEPGGPVVGVVIEPNRNRIAREMLGAASELAAEIDGCVAALTTRPPVSEEIAAWGADASVVLADAEVEEDVAIALTRWVASVEPWAILAPGTAWGREVASRVAAATGSGLTGDAVGLAVRDGRLVADKPAFGGATVAEILCSSPTQLATVRPGVLPLLRARHPQQLESTTLSVQPVSAVRVLERRRDDDSDDLANARVVIGVGQGISPEDYPLLERYAAAIGASLCATRKVTDKGWMPRARQVGITGHTITPRLYIGIGLSGKFNHTVGVRTSGTIVGINPDATAPLFDCCDIGIVGDWKDVFAGLIPALAS